MADAPGTRERILATTIELIDAEGEGGLRLDRVAELAQVAKQSVYNLFGDREGLIIAAHTEQYRRILTGLDYMVDGLIDCVTVDDFAKLILTVASMATVFGTKARRLRIQALGAAVTRPALQDAIREVHQASSLAVAKVVLFGQKRGWVTTTYSHVVISDYWFSTITGYHIAEHYAAPGDVRAVGDAAVDGLSLLMFGRVYPQYSTERPDPQ